MANKHSLDDIDSPYFYTTKNPNAQPLFTPFNPGEKRLHLHDMDNNNNKRDSRKRQRIEDAFSSLTIDSEMMINSDNENSDALSMGDKMRSTSSSENGASFMSTSNGMSSTTCTIGASNAEILEDMDFLSDDNDDASSVAPAISAEEKQALYNLVFGSNKSRKVGDRFSATQSIHQNSHRNNSCCVDSKIEEIIRKSRLQAASQSASTHASLDGNVKVSASSMEMKNNHHNNDNNAKTSTSNRYFFNSIGSDEEMTGSNIIVKEEESSSSTESPRFLETPSHGDFIAVPSSSSFRASPDRSGMWSEYRREKWSNVSSFGDSSTAGGIGGFDYGNSSMDCNIDL